MCHSSFDEALFAPAINSEVKMSGYSLIADIVAIIAKECGAQQDKES